MAVPDPARALTVRIEGAGIAGRVLHRELGLRGIASVLVDRSAFPRDKVCGGCLQADSWDALRSLFGLGPPAAWIPLIRQFRGGRKISSFPLHRPMAFVPRLELDASLSAGPPVPPPGPDASVLVVDAGGARGTQGGWLGFQAECGPTDALEMHYGRGVYAGVCPDGKGKGHAAFVVLKSRFDHPDGLPRLLRDELGLDVQGPFKGTQALDYRSPTPPRLAVGDAMLLTHPFLGLGMKHAILSAKLLARTIAEGRTDDYARRHRRAFARYRRASRLADRLMASSAPFLLDPFLTDPVFGLAYRFLHRPIKKI